MIGSEKRQEEETRRRDKEVKLARIVDRRRDQKGHGDILNRR
jgi:hypothetical protein